MRMLLVASSALCLAAGPALAQPDDSGADRLDSPTSLRCSALALIAEAERPMALYFIAGYGTGERDATTIGTVGASTETAADPGAGAQTPADPAGGQAPAQAAPESGGASVAVLPTIPVDTVIAACAQSPDSRIVDVMTASGVMLTR